MKEKSKTITIRLVLILCLILFAFLLTGCENETTEIETLDDLNNGKVIGTVNGSIYPDMLKELYPDSEIKEYNGLMDAVLALQNGKVDATVYDEPTVAHIAEENSDLKLLSEKIADEDYYFCTAKTEEGIALAEDFDLWLSGLKESGSLDEIKDFWIGNEDVEGRCDLSELTGENGTLVVGTSVGSRPDTYLYNNSYVGFPLEIIYLYCKDRGLNIEIKIMDIAAFPMALSTGKVDIFASFLSYTEERAENMTFTDSIYSGGVAVIVRENETEDVSSFFSNIIDGFDKTFIRDGRWKTILSGLAETGVITLFGFILANLLGAVFCAFNLSKSKLLHIISDIYSRLMQGIPMIVILMILYYVILGKTRLSGTWVSVIGFGLVTGSTLAQSFEGAIRGIDKGQSEASLALGFSRTQTFFGIIFPQAVRSILPSYFSELVALFKGTSIVGYIAVVDLTKVSDIIRASTYEAFFPLISIAFIYFIIINILLSIMKIISKRLEPKHVTGKEIKK